MTSQETAGTTARPAFTTRAKVGLVVVGLLGLLDCFATFITSDGGPPDPVTMIDTALGVITVVAVAVGWWSRRRGALRIAAGARVLSAITALPAFFASEATPGWVVAAAVFIVVTLVGVVLMLSPARRTLGPATTE